MKKFAFALMALCTQSLASGYPMSGQDTTLTLSGGATVSLKDSRRESLSLVDGGKYRFRFSTKSQSFHLMPGDGRDYEFKVEGGFPGGNLDSLTLSGAQYGNAGIGLVRSTYRATLSEGDQNVTGACQYYCGQDYVCRNVPENRCYTEYETSCRDVRHQDCSTRPVERCETKYEQQCGYVARFCSGQETYTVHSAQLEDRIDLTLTDEANSNATLALFRDVTRAYQTTTRTATIQACQ